MAATGGILKRAPRGAIVQTFATVDPHQHATKVGAIPGKSEEELALLMAAFADKPIFSKLDRAQLLEVARVMSKSEKAGGEHVMTEGDHGESFHVLLTGTCTVRMGGRLVRELGPGAGFGEIALIYNQPRTATVEAKADCVFFTLNRGDYRHVVVESIKRQRTQYEALLQHVPLFQALEKAGIPGSRAKAADALTVAEFKAGAVLIRQGDKGDLFYIVADGNVEITDSTRPEFKIEKGVGAFFGEIALLQHVPRTATVTATCPTKCLTLDRTTFGRLFGQAEVDIMSQQIDADGGYQLPTAKHVTRKAELAAAHEATKEFITPKMEDFEMGVPVGFGAFGWVRIAQHKETGTYCAIKAMSKAYLYSKRQIKHAKAERDLLRMCSHSGVVKLYGSFQDDEYLYLCLEFLNGGELFTLLGQKGRLSNESARALASEIVAIFDYLHAHDIIYRDLKPENVMLDAGGHIRLIDFGLAKLCSDRTWTMCGTPEYLAPEVVLNQGHNKGADYWTLGVLIYEMLVGVPPFYDENASDDETFNRILKERPRFPSFVGANAKDIILNLMHHDVTRRLGCMADGTEGLRIHYWFKGIDWNEVAGQRMDMPFVPKLDGGGDLRHFEVTQEEILARKRLFERQVLPAEAQKLFGDF